MAYSSKDGKKFTNRPPMMQHNRSMDSHSGAGGGTASLMGRTDPLAQPGEGTEQEPEMGDRPVHTEHHAEGGHTTHHESGAQKHTTTAEELVDHLKKHLPEEEQEIAGGEEPEYE